VAAFEVPIGEILYGAKVPSPISSHITSQTPESLALRVNSYFRKIRDAKVKGDAVPPYLNEKWAQSQDHLPKVSATKTNPEWLTEDGDAGTQFDPSLGFARPIYLLQDRSCLSACENIVQEFEAHPCAISIGENTGGMFHFGTVSPLILHHSRLTVFMPTDYWKFKDGRFLEKTGMAPKIRVDPGDDALDIALKAAAKGTKCGS
jgi:hypothetical protein